jgi:hypothetical protein
MQHASRSRSREASIEFLLDQGGIFEQSNYFAPDDLIKKILSDQAAVIANRAAQLAPTVGADAFVVVNFGRACVR